MKRKSKMVFMIVIGIFVIFTFIRCYTAEPVRNRYAKKLLSEKYNEEFEVLSTWGNGGQSYYALCYPVRDRSIVFEGNFALDHDDFRDEYDRAIFSKKVSEIMQPKLDALFQECYVYPAISSQESGLTDKEEITIKSFIEATKTPEIHFLVGINIDVYKQPDFKMEYKRLEQYLSEMTGLDECPTMHLYFLSEDAYKQFVEYYKNDVDMKGKMLNIVNGYQDISFGFKDGNLNKSEAEYVSLRKGR